MTKICAGIILFLLFGAAAAPGAEITVSAAASLANAFDEIKSVFAKLRPGLTIHANYAASDPLLKQMIEGAPVDVFASADQETMDKAAAATVIDPTTRRTFAANELVVIVPKGAKKPANPQELASFGRIAAGNPDSVPAGRYTRAALKAAGMWEKLQPNIIPCASVRQALDYVARGEADAGFVYGTDARQLADKAETAFAAGGHEPVTYPIAVAVTGANPEAGQQFVDFVLSPAGQEILARHGFSKP